jgi:hypothetical protein
MMSEWIFAHTVLTLYLDLPILNHLCQVSQRGRVFLADGRGDKRSRHQQSQDHTDDQKWSRFDLHSTPPLVFS